MKKYIIIATIFFTTTLIASNELSWVDLQIEAIKPPRKSISDNALNRIKNPFIYLKQNKKTDKSKSSRSQKSTRNSTARSSTTKGSKQPTQKLTTSSKPTLSAIINKSALINAKWYMVDDSVAGYKISAIKTTSVVLTRGSKKMILTTSDRKQKIKFK